MAGVNPMNFDKGSFANVLAPVTAAEKMDMDMEIYLYEDKRGAIIDRIKKGRLGDRVEETGGGSYFELFDTGRRKTFYFFESGVPLGYLLNRAVNRSFLAFQSILDIFFLHCASIVMDDRLYLFVAPSGGGKSTVSSFAREAGFSVLDEESCVVKRKRDRFFAGLFPFCLLPGHADKEREVGGVFFLNKSGTNKVRKISAIEAVRRALPEATCLYHDHVPQGGKAGYRKHVFQLLNLMFENVDFRLLDFNKHPGVLSCLRST